MNKWQLLLLNIVISIGLVFFFAPQFSLLHFINALFYIGYFYLMVSIGIYIISKGFFNGITYSFRRFISRLPKNRDLLNEWEDKPLPSARVSTSFAGKLLFQGAILTGIMLVLLVIYYL